MKVNHTLTNGQLKKTQPKDMNIQTTRQEATYKPPPFLLGSALIFWGWQSGLIIISFIMALILEVRFWINIRWEFTIKDFYRASDFCALLVICIVFYFFMTIQSVFAIFSLIKWLPMAFFPILFIQNYNTRDKTDIRAISLLFRRQKAKYDTVSVPSINLNYPYFGLVVLSASFANIRTPAFYMGLSFLSAWALLTIRSRRFSLILWSGFFVMACYGGIMIHMGLTGLQKYLEQKGMEWFFNLSEEDADPYVSYTAIGHIGKMKLSNKILFRVKPGPKVFVPLLLREASYDRYLHEKWFATYSLFRKIYPDHDKSTWTLALFPYTYKNVIISAPLKSGKGMLKLPDGTFLLKNLKNLELSQNQYGAIKINNGPGRILYQALFSERSAIDSKPSQADLFINKKEKPVIKNILKQLGIDGKKPEEIIGKLRVFFEKNFTYSLDLNPGYSPTHLAYFLKKARSGHCEYFATAGVLLLRGCGIPARYATGFSAHEKSVIDNWIVVRARHAHAWILAYVDGDWKNVDFTPPSWRSAEDKGEFPFQFFSDFVSWIMFHFSIWQWDLNDDMAFKIGILLILPALFILGRGFFKKKKVKKVKRKIKIKSGNAKKTPPSSAFYAVEKHLENMGFKRHPNETVKSWIKRIEMSAPSIGLPEQLIELHYKLRFHPHGLLPEESEKMKYLAEKWILSMKKWHK